MSPGDWVWPCIAAAAGLLFLATYGWDAWHKRRTDRRFQATAREAARTPATVAEDVATRKTARQQNEAAEAAEDMATCLAIWDITQHDIPHQTRRTEEDQ